MAKENLKAKRKVKSKGGIPIVRNARKIRLKELPMFTRQVSAMLSAGMPLVQTLTAMEQQTDEKSFKAVINGIRTRVEGGSMYSEALASYPTIFDSLYISMMRAGEVGGILPDTCSRVAMFLESSNKLRAKVKSAMMYPTVVIVVSLVLSTALIMFVLPVFVGMFADFGADLPGLTQALLDFSHLLTQYWYIAGSIVAAIIYTLKYYNKTDKGEYNIDKFRLRFPIIGELVTKVAISRFASTFAQLMHSGVQIIESLEIVGLATGNRVIGDSLFAARKIIEEGQPLSTALETNPYYPRMLIHMLSAGEKTGQVEEMMDKVAEFYESEVETMLAGLTSMIEPLLMVIIGAIIGTIVVAMFLPIFKMSEIVM
ncbi:type II secretion system F family protein [Pontiella sulfatireligans]|uniref:General secretion pathway protein F n=1 Tax=Pontiella sulfatireligans TaxID=2750658 RepID=A0A6C2UIP9_9BACT|nr:type II secretion system F family protein [Pontiella sulfatireligans]VGO20080.1 Type II secretion system protein F [Pontiella sulfatireligans]